MNEFSEAEIPGWYYEPLNKETGGLPHAAGVAAVTEGIHRKIGGESEEIQARVHRIFSENVGGPEYLKPAALELAGTSLMMGGEVYIWTVGDHGEGSSYYQRAKIEASRIDQDLKYILRKNGFEEKIVDEHFHIVIAPERKIEELKQIMQDASNKRINAVFLADDKEENIKAAEQASSDFPEIELHGWFAKDDSDKAGNLTAFKDHVLKEAEKLHQSGKRFALVLDWDDTASLEQARMRVIRQALSKEFLPQDQELKQAA